MAHDLPPIDRDSLERALISLRPREREVLLLCAHDKLQTDEIADRLGITPRRAERLLANALRRLDRALERRERPWWRFW